MQLKRLRLSQYRNLRNLEILPSGGMSLYSGRNGQGKTNLLEAIYFLGYGKSFRTTAVKDCIQHGRKECRIEGTVEHGALSRDMEIRITRTEKKLFLFGKAVTLDAFLGNVHILAFAQQHLQIVRGAPAERRAFLDRAMISLYPGHVRCLAAYGRALKQRNKLLSTARDARYSIDENLLDSWDEAIIEQGARILWNRIRYVKQMKEALPQGLFSAEVLKMHYFSTVMNPSESEDFELADIAGCFRQRLLETRPYDKKIGSTSVGPHRDDLKLYIDGKSLIDFGSAGQQRSSLIALYFSQMEIHYKNHGFYPLFLMDDVEAELDELRLRTFLEYLSQRTQTLLTSAKGFLLSSIDAEIAHFEIRDGMISPKTGIKRSARLDT